MTYKFDDNDLNNPRLTAAGVITISVIKRLANDKGEFTFDEVANVLPFTPRTLFKSMSCLKSAGLVIKEKRIFKLNKYIMKPKEQQGYEPKPTFPMCSNCQHFRSDKVMNQWKYEEEKNIRCRLGGFAIKKQGTCNKHLKKEI